MNIKHITTILIIICCFLLLKKGNTQIIRGTVIAGFNTSQVDGDEVYGFRRYGLNVGAAATIPFKKKWSVSLETLYSQKGSYQAPRFNDDESGEYSLFLNYVEVPVLVHFTDKEKITVGTGLSWGRLVDVREFEHGNRVETTTLDGPYATNDVNILADLRFRMYKRLHFNLRYAYSISSIRTRYYPKIDETRDQYNNVISFRLLYIFNEIIPEKKGDD